MPALTVHFGEDIIKIGKKGLRPGTRENDMREDLIKRLEEFQKTYPVEERLRSRLMKPPVEFIGEEIMEQAVFALLQGENILLSGGKATG